MKTLTQTLTTLLLIITTYSAGTAQFIRGNIQAQIKVNNALNRPLSTDTYSKKKKKNTELTKRTADASISAQPIVRSYASYNPGAPVGFKLLNQNHSTYSFLDLKEEPVGVQPKDLRTKDESKEIVDYQTIRLQKNNEHNAYDGIQKNAYTTTSNSSEKMAVGALIGGIIGLAVGAKIGLASAEGDGIAGIVTAPLKMGLGIGLGTVLGAGLGGSIGRNIGSKNKNRDQIQKLRSM